MFLCEDGNAGKLQGERVKLRILTEEDLSERLAMCNNSEVQVLMSGQASATEISLEDMKNWFIVRKNEKNSIQFAIEYAGKYIGDIDLHSVDKEAGSAGIIPMIGYKEYWGMGLGTEALNLVKQYARDCLSLSKLTLEVFPFNERAVKAYMKLGFIIEGETSSKELSMSVNLK